MAMKTDEEIFNDYCIKNGIDDFYKTYFKNVIMETYHFKKYHLSVRWSEFIQSLKNGIAKYFKRIKR